MGAYLSTDIVSPKVVAAGGQLAGGFTFKAPAAGFFYLTVEQYTSALAFIPGSRAYLYRAVAGGTFVNSTVNYTVLAPVIADAEEDISAVLTLPNTDCYLYVFLKQIASVIVATALVAGTTYKILTLGTTDFTLVGAVSNTVGVVFVATGAGLGTGTVCTMPDPDIDETIDYVVITTQSSTAVAGGLDMSSLMNLMITMMIIGMMMKMMTGVVKS